MNRRKLREHLFKLVYLSAFNKENEMPSQRDLYFELNPEIDGEDRDFISARLDGVMSATPEIDEMLNRTARGWKTARFASCDLAVLRLALYEMRFDPDEIVPQGVAINEAVELARKFGGDDSPAFVNGILGEIAKAGADDQ